MPIRRYLIPAGVGLFFLASAVVALNLSGTQPGTDGPVSVTSHPAANLALTVRLNHGRLILGRALTVQVELTNTGTQPVALQPDGVCTTPLRLELHDFKPGAHRFDPRSGRPAGRFQRTKRTAPGEIKMDDDCQLAS